ncbi:hypothetical protein [Elioraea rosea]|uniref:hypothetical protein n=1 Tax=Elioraea rosea TaxID=2492390 RepID=UPI001182B1AD|nr:hypothetical protein [Elioraea rosea]
MPLYRDIRGRLSARTVPLLYRVLAAEPGCLAWAWNILAPCASSGILCQIGQSARRAIGAPPRMPLRAACRLVGLDDAGADAALAIVAAFNHANPKNFAALAVLIKAAETGLAPRADVTAAPPAPDPLPVLTLADMTDDARSTIAFLASCGGRHAAPAIPTLWSVLAAYPPALSLAAASLASDFAASAIDTEAAAIRAAAVQELDSLRSEPVRLPAPSHAAHLAAIAPFFVDMIPRMIAIGARLHPLFQKDAAP